MSRLSASPPRRRWVRCPPRAFQPACAGHVGGARSASRLRRRRWVPPRRRRCSRCRPSRPCRSCRDCLSSRYRFRLCPTGHCCAASRGPRVGVGRAARPHLWPGGPRSPRRTRRYRLLGLRRTRPPDGGGCGEPEVTLARLLARAPARRGRVLPRTPAGLLGAGRRVGGRPGDAAAQASGRRKSRPGSRKQERRSPCRRLFRLWSDRRRRACARSLHGARVRCTARAPVLGSVRRGGPEVLCPTGRNLRRRPLFGPKPWGPAKASAAPVLLAAAFAAPG